MPAPPCPEWTPPLRSPPGTGPSARVGEVGNDNRVRLRRRGPARIQVRVRVWARPVSVSLPVSGSTATSGHPGRSGNEVSCRERRDEEGFTPEPLLPAFTVIPARGLLPLPPSSVIPSGAGQSPATSRDPPNEDGAPGTRAPSTGGRWRNRFRAEIAGISGKRNRLAHRFFPLRPRDPCARLSPPERPCPCRCPWRRPRPRHRGIVMRGARRVTRLPVRATNGRGTPQAVKVPNKASTLGSARAAGHRCITRVGRRTFR